MGDLNSMKIAAIVVTFNRKELLKENIKCLLNQTMKDLFDIIIIDNHSTDDTRSEINIYIKNKDIIYKDTGSNLGGAGGFQFGIKYAAEHNYDYIWVMDDDCMPTKTALEEFLNVDKKLNGQYGFLSSKVLWKDHTICVMNRQRKNMIQTVSDFNSETVPIVMASFVSLFMPTKIVYELGLPIKEFFIWTDDWEYTRRISLKYPCYLCNKSMVVHKSKSNIGANIANDSLDRLERYTYLYRNDVYLYRREGLYGFVYESFRLIFHILRVIFRGKNKKNKRISYVWNGTLKGLSFYPKIEFPKRNGEGL